MTVRSKDKGGRLVSWIAAVEQVEPNSEEWEAVVPLLAKTRLKEAPAPISPPEPPGPPEDRRPEDSWQKRKPRTA